MKFVSSLAYHSATGIFLLLLLCYYFYYMVTSWLANVADLSIAYDTIRSSSFFKLVGDDTEEVARSCTWLASILIP